MMLDDNRHKIHVNRSGPKSCLKNLLKEDNNFYVCFTIKTVHEFMTESLKIQAKNQTKNTTLFGGQRSIDLSKNNRERWTIFFSFWYCVLFAICHSSPVMKFSLSSLSSNFSLKNERWKSFVLIDWLTHPFFSIPLFSLLSPTHF